MIIEISDRCIIKKLMEILTIDNYMIVRYDPEILKKYKFHINLEYCASIMSIKYISPYYKKISPPPPPPCQESRR